MGVLDFIETSKPARVEAGRWRKLLRGGAGVPASSPEQSAAARTDRPAKSAARRRSTG